MPEVKSLDAGRNGIRIPGWLITALVAAVAVFGAGYAAGERVRSETARVETIELRLCRIEAALNIQPWPSCPTPGSSRGTP